MEEIMIFDRKCIKISEVIIMRKDKDTWSIEVPRLSLPFPMFLVNRDVLCVRQNCLHVYLILKLLHLPPLQSIVSASSCSLSAMSTVKHVGLMVGLTLTCFHRFIVFSENRNLSVHLVLQGFVSTDAAGLLKHAPKRTHVFNRVLDEDFVFQVHNN